ncbi:MAG TPA: hypothetical protein DCZ03_00920 [Gammaproteobacteria bacterium]|nr:hypothetical protein [Gammaproteobacteria bacterium]
MLKSIKQFFDEKLSVGKGQDTADDEHRMQLATAALLFEICKADYDTTQIEIDTVKQAIQQTFSLPEEAAVELVNLAEQELQDSTSYHQFTSLINQNFSPEQKVEVVENLWMVAFADGQLDKYEEHLIRRLADLLHVPHAQFIAAKHRVQEQLF